MARPSTGLMDGHSSRLGSCQAPVYSSGGTRTANSKGVFLPVIQRGEIRPHGACSDLHGDQGQGQFSPQCLENHNRAQHDKKRVQRSSWVELSGCLRALGFHQQCRAENTAVEPAHPQC